jgi:nucleoside-diphosphate-sugar epimerase
MFAFKSCTFIAKELHMQTILGASGIIGTELAKALKAFTNAIRIVSRSPQRVNDTDELMTADLLDAKQTMEAVKGSDVVYLTVGLIYSAKIWQQQWPVVMANVINACKLQGAKLVFFDNVYMYGRVMGSMTEATPFKPDSKKGQVRAQVAGMVLQGIQEGSLTALIARAPEFYGPGKTQSGVNAMLFDNIRKGKKAQWLINDANRRTFIYTPDAAKATALLGNTPSAFNQTWHLPCSDEVINGKQFVALAEKVYGRSLPYTILKKGMLWLIGLFIPVVREIRELLYQFEQDYIFDSSKFKQAFPSFAITTYEEGIRAIAAEHRPQ